MNGVRRFLTRKSLPLFLITVAVLLALPSAWTGWQLDDISHRYFLLGNPDFEGNTHSALEMFSFLSGDTVRTHAMMCGVSITRISSLLNTLEIKTLHFLSRPGGLAEKLQARGDAWVLGEAPDGNPAPHLFPAIPIHQRPQDHFQCYPLQRVVGLGHCQQCLDETG